MLEKYLYSFVMDFFVGFFREDKERIQWFFFFYTFLYSNYKLVISKGGKKVIAESCKYMVLGVDLDNQAFKIILTK